MQRHEPGLAILFMLGGAGSFAVMGLVAKAGTGLYPSTELLFFRGLVAFLFLLGWLGLGGKLRAARTGRPVMQFAAGLLWACSSLCFFGSLLSMPVSTSVAISFILPLVTTLMAAVVLRERVRPANWAAIALGLFGVLLVAPPGQASLDFGLILAVINPILYASSLMVMRRYGGADSGDTTSFYALLSSALAGLCGLPLGWNAPRLGDWPILLGLGFFAFGGVIMSVAAVRRAPSRIVMPFFYVQALVVFIGGYFLFGEVLRPVALLGTLLIIVSGLLTILIERGRT